MTERFLRVKSYRHMFSLLPPMADMAGKVYESTPWIL
jgi:hypothetical protein